jgi:hypothetical protein
MMMMKIIIYSHATSSIVRQGDEYEIGHGTAVQSLLDAGANPDIAEEARILKSII